MSALEFWILALCLTVRSVAAPLAVEFEVVDEDNAPVAGAAVSCDCVPRLAPDPWNAPARRLRVETTADANGRGLLSGEHALPECVISAAAPGFHVAARRILASDGAARLVLPRRLGAAACVRVESLTRALPDDGAEHGFDLELGAFTAPLGVGRHADVWLRGRCPSAALPRGSGAAYVDEVAMRFAESRTGVVAVPRPGQPGFAESISPNCAGMLLPSLLAPRLAPGGGYVPALAYRSARGASPLETPGPGRVGAPQWIFRIQRPSGWLHGLITDFGWVPDGRLRLTYRISTEPGNLSLDFGPQ